MAKHRGSFKLDKFLKALDPQLRVQYFAKYSIVFPSDLNFDDDSLVTFWGSIAEENRVEIDEKLHCINDTRIGDRVRKSGIDSIEAKEYSNHYATT